ncbi:hypothetical protein B0A78_13305 [Flavobacterium columnare NBRC 100251 = ATCC 23463]|nr:hypothetical protein BU993_06810 [Flavobacterium columnare]OOB83449.1 hypothetical protein BZL53_06890 [Flavobacterium columnare]PDS21940.1 hypothetical protein B0A78_13305 [Flavobacterium columnare NBRC 100251 = ATCC 23463]GEM58991.1 hypothetical protein FC1_22290 [Flavobacterium columnare NBRC 100251 = ATCC 23463]
MKKKSISLLIILFIIFSCKNDTTKTESVSANTQNTNKQGDYKKSFLQLRITIKKELYTQPFVKVVLK